MRLQNKGGAMSAGATAVYEADVIGIRSDPVPANQPLSTGSYWVELAATEPLGRAIEIPRGHAPVRLHLGARQVRVLQADEV